jgi:putative intracellular protease/amidase
MFLRETEHAMKILMIVTSHATLGNSGQKTGFWLEELATPYYAFLAAGAEVDLASPRGGPAPADPKSAADPKGAAQRFLADADAMAKLASTKKLSDVGSDYDAFFVVGGHGVMWDLPDDATIPRLLGRAFDAGKVVAAVCHGLAALVSVKRADGAPIVKERRVTGFSNEEEEIVKLTEVVPFALETRLRELGGRYERAPTWGAFAVRDGNLVTGQIPASSALVAQMVLEALA